MAAPPLEFLTGKLVSLIENEVSLLGGFRDEREEIKRELRVMKAFLTDAETKRSLSAVEKAWVEDVRDASLQVEDMIEDITYQMNKQRSWGPNYWDKRRMATKLQKLIGRIKTIPEMKQRYGVDRIEGMGTSHNHDLNWIKIHGESSLFFEDDEIVGIKDAKLKLLGWLLSEKPQRTVIAVVGMGGSGKTTLVANTFNSQAVKKHFDCYAWITISQTYHFEDLLRLIINELFRAAKQDIPQDLSNMSYRQCMEILVGYLRPKRYVIVLDDVWDINLWSKIYKALPDGEHGSRVILTTRKEDIALSSFGVESHVHHVEPLNQKEAWELFSKKAFSSWPDSVCPPELQRIARDLIGKCTGLPLGIATLGALMSTKRVQSEWEQVHRNLSWELDNNPTLEVVKSISLLSFNELPYRLKHCFLYFCIFPEDYEIQNARLALLWLAEGFVEKVDGQRPEDTAENYITQLTCRCMVQVVERRSGKLYTVKMHDILRELAISISRTEKFCTTYNHHGETIDESFAPHRLSIQANYGVLQAHKNLSKVRSFFTFPSQISNVSSSMEKLPSGFKRLRVLDVQDVPIVQLPKEMVKFFNLKYLNLRRTKVRVLPEGIGNLRNLETLDVRGSNIRLLPAGIVKLQNLRHLHLYHTNYENVMEFDFFTGTRAPLKISKLKSLQVLDGIEVGGTAMIKQLGEMTQLVTLGLINVREADQKGLCKSLESMKLIQDFSVKTIDEDEVLCLDALPSAPPSLRSLSLIGKLHKLPVWFHSLESLTDLHLHWSRLTNDDFLQDIQALTNLITLRLHAHVGNQLVFHSGFFKLTVLGLYNMPQLKAVVIERGVMPSLETLNVVGCWKVKQLPQGIEHLKCLQTFRFHGIHSELAEQISTEGSLDHAKVMHIPEISIRTKTQFESNFNYRREEG